jgi:Ca-activated chloride channel homolog
MKHMLTPPLGTLVLLLGVVTSCEGSSQQPPASGQSIVTPSTVSAAPAVALAPIDVTIVYGSEKKTWLEQQIGSFNASNAKLADGAIIHVSGKAMGSGEAMAAIVAGDKPAIFSPASSAYIALLNEQWQSAHAKPLAPSSEPLVLSPLVIAMWKPMAEALGWPKKALGWADLLKIGSDPKGWGVLGRPEWGKLKFGHTHPGYSNSGLLSVLAIAYAGAKTTRGLTAADVAKTEPYIAKIESSIVHYGKSTGFFADKMVERGTSYLSAAVLYENVVIESYTKASVSPLVAIYPVEGTFWSDHPYAILDGTWVSPSQRAGAEVFLAYLKAKPQQLQAMAMGFRPVDPTIKIAPPIDESHGVDPLQPQTLLEVPSASVLNALLASWRKTKKTSDVVVVFDKSGSMAGSPLEQAKAGAKQFLRTLDARDQVTLLFFDNNVYPPYGPVTVGTKLAELDARIDGVAAAGETAMLSATKKAYELLASRAKTSANRIRAAVVMTDGNDNRSTVSQQDLMTLLGGESRQATIFTIAYGGNASRDSMKNLADAGGGSFSTGDISSIVEVYRDLAAFF